MQKTIMGVFSSGVKADAALNALADNGFDNRDVSVITSESSRTTDDKVVERGSSVGEHVAAGAVSGATAGGVLAGIAGLLFGLGAITIPGVGALLIGGPIAAALGLTGAAATTVSAATTGVLAGGLIGALGGLGVPEKSARVYEERIKSGGVLLAVPVDDEDEEADVRSILTTSGAEELNTVAAAF